MSGAPARTRRPPGARLPAPLGDERFAKVKLPPPTLTLEQYTSLCAELTVRPERRSEILPRYKVYGDAAHAALDAWWREHFAKHPDARAAFERDLARFTEWLRTQ